MRLVEALAHIFDEAEIVVHCAELIEGRLHVAGRNGEYLVGNGVAPDDRGATPESGAHVEAPHETAGKPAKISFGFALAALLFRLVVLVVTARDGFDGLPEKSLDRAGCRPVLAALRRVPDGEGAIARARNPDPGRADVRPRCG